jgi:hypothetical protein
MRRVEATAWENGFTGTEHVAGGGPVPGSEVREAEVALREAALAHAVAIARLLIAKCRAAGDVPDCMFAGRAWPMPGLDVVCGVRVDHNDGGHRADRLRGRSGDYYFLEEGHGVEEGGAAPGVCGEDPAS